MGRPKGRRDKKPRKVKENRICKFSDDCEKCPLADCKVTNSFLYNRHQFLSEAELFGATLTKGNENAKPRGRFSK